MPHARKIWLKYSDKIELSENEILAAHKIANQLMLIHGLEKLEFIISCPPKPFDVPNAKELFSVLDIAKDKKVNPVNRFLAAEDHNPINLYYKAFAEEISTFELYENIKVTSNFYPSKRFKFSISYWVEIKDRQVVSRNENLLILKNCTSSEVLGYISRSGCFTPERGAFIPKPIISLFLNACDDPKAAIINYGQDTGNCSFCDRELTDPISLRRKYGTKCAQNHDEPWG